MNNNGKLKEVTYWRNPRTEEVEVFPGSIKAKAEVRRARGLSPERCSWVQYGYSKQMELAKQTGVAFLAIQAELYRLHFEAWNKKEPISFGLTKPLRALEISRYAKNRAIKALENAGWVSVEWRNGKSPLVTILGGFYPQS